MKQDSKKEEIQDKKLAALEETHGEGNVRTLVVKENDVELKAYLLDPSKVKNKRILYSRCATYLRQDKVQEIGELVIAECFLDGDERFKNVDDFVAISAAHTAKDFLGLLKVEGA